MREQNISGCSGMICAWLFEEYSMKSKALWESQVSQLSQ